MSNSLPQPPEQIAHPPLKRQLPFSSMKPPFSVPANYHRFGPDLRRLTSDQEDEAIIVKSPRVSSRNYNSILVAEVGHGDRCLGFRSLASII